MVESWRKYAAWLAMLGVLAGGVVGCTNSPAGPVSTTSATASGVTITPAPPTSAPRTTSATASAVYPADVPAEARVNSPAGAMAFARYFFAQVNKAYTTPQAGLIRPLADPTCLSCASFAENADVYVQKGQRYSTEPIRVLEVTPAPDAGPADGRLIDVVARQQKATLLDATGRPQDTFSEKEGIFLVNLRWSEDRWYVRKIQVRQ